MSRRRMFAEPKVAVPARQAVPRPDPAERFPHPLHPPVVTPQMRSHLEFFEGQGVDPDIARSLVATWAEVEQRTMQSIEDSVRDLMLAPPGRNPLAEFGSQMHEIMQIARRTPSGLPSDLVRNPPEVTHNAERDFEQNRRRVITTYPYGSRVDEEHLRNGPIPGVCASCGWSNEGGYSSECCGSRDMRARRRDGSHYVVMIDEADLVRGGANRLTFGQRVLRPRSE